MRRSISIATLAALLSLPAWAQMRGGRGISARPAGGMHAPVGMNRPSPNRGGFGFNNGRFGRPFGFHHHHHHFFAAAFGYGLYGYPGWYGDPLDYSYSDYDQSSNQNQQLQAYELQMMTNQQQIEQRVDALEERLDRLLEQRSAPAPQSQPQAKSEPSQPAVLVYKDGHKQEVQNYAIVGQTIWVLNEQQAKKVPLSALDLNATRKANEDRGVDFALPALSS
jgi:hypothetical protein